MRRLKGQHTVERLVNWQSSRSFPPPVIVHLDFSAGIYHLWAGATTRRVSISPAYDRNGSSCWLWVQRLSLELMADRRWITRSYVASVAALLLVTAIGSTLLHWHSDWNDQRCQLCHVRQLPSALGPVAEGPAYPVLTDRDWLADNPAYELESFFVRFSSRAPPRSTSFTVS